MIAGSMVAIVTPMQKDMSIDWPSFEGLIDWHIEEGTDAIVAAGTTGECATLDTAEHIDVIKRCVEYVKGRIPVVAGTGSNSTSEAIHLTREAKQAGADACLLVAPYYNKPSQEGLYLHHKLIAESVDIPQILYNVPGRTAVDMSAETVIRLSKIKNIVGIKEATGDIQRLLDIREGVTEDFSLLSGDDETSLAFLKEGGHGVISVTANVAPAAIARVCALAKNAQYEEAQAIMSTLCDLNKALFVEANPIPVKWALAEMGKIAGDIRLPLTPLQNHYHETVRKALTVAEAI